MVSLFLFCGGRSGIDFDLVFLLSVSVRLEMLPLLLRALVVHVVKMC